MTTKVCIGRKSGVVGIDCTCMRAGVCGLGLVHEVCLMVSLCYEVIHGLSQMSIIMTFGSAGDKRCCERDAWWFPILRLITDATFLFIPDCWCL